MKVLIVDDNEINRELLNECLKSEYELDFCEDGIEALDVLAERIDSFDLMILDVIMPKMGGFQVLKKMNENGWIKKIPVLLISVDYSPEFVEKAFDLGAFDFIGRPFNEQIIKRRMNNAIFFGNKNDDSELKFMTIDNDDYL